MQVHITYTSGTNVTVSWATGEGIVTASPVSGYAAEEAGPGSTVWYGTSSGNYTTNTSSTIFTSYTQTYNFSNANPILNYSSPLFHHVTIQNLTPSTLYYYKCGDVNLGMSQEFNFTSPPAVGPTTYPFVLGVVADTGLTPNTTVTIQHLTDAKPQVWTLIGDFSYADDMQTNGKPATYHLSATAFELLHFCLGFCCDSLHIVWLPCLHDRWDMLLCCCRPRVGGAMSEPVCV